MEPSDEDRQRADKMFSDLASHAQKLGLYLEEGKIVPLPGQEEEPDEYPKRVAVLGVFAIGDRAWSARVQDPEQHKFDESFREIRVETETDEFNQAREQLQQMADEDEQEDG